MTKKQKKSLIALLIVFAVLTVGFFAVVRPLVNRLTPSKSSEPLELLDGEAYYYNQGYHKTTRVLFPQFSRADLYSVSVWNKDTNYQFVHVLSDASANAENYFLLGSDSDGDGESELYLPELVTAFPDFEYSTLYDDTSKIPTVISVTGSCFFKDRVYVRAQDAANPDDSAYQSILAAYGLAAADNPSYYEIKGYTIDRNRNLVYGYYEELLGMQLMRQVYQSVAANGKVSYYTLDTTEAEAWSEELGNYDFENCFTPYTGSLDGLQPIVDPNRSYKVFVGDRTPDRTGYYLRVSGRDVVYTTGTSSIGDVVNKSLAYYVNPRIMATSEEMYGPLMALDFGLWQKGEALSSVKAGAGVLYSASVSLSGKPVGAESGMLHLLKGKVSDRLYAALLGKAIGDKVDVVVAEKGQLLTTLETTTLEYVFYSIDGIVGVDSINRTAGAAVSAGDTVLVTYRLAMDTEVDGEMTEMLSELYCGAVDLSDPLLTPSVKNALVGKAVGGDPTGKTELVRAEVKLDQTYADTFRETYRIAEIVGFATNESMSDINTVKNAALPTTGYAQIYCTQIVNGLEEGTYIVINLEQESTYQRELIRRALIGKANGVLANPIDIAVRRYYSAVQDYVLYEDMEILAINSYAEQLSFKFVNELYRDKFHGATGLYEITGPVDRTLYTLDSDATKNALMDFADLIGTETVAVGITAERIKEYGLDAHVFYYEYPFGIGEDPNDGNDKIVTYDYKYSVPYIIYVSEKQADGSYYVASTLYDTVVKATDEQIGFVDWDFFDTWMHASIMQLSVFDIAELTFDINFSDLKEKHSFSLMTNSKYYVYAGVNANGDAQWDEQQRLYVSYVEGDRIEYEIKTVNEAKVVLDNRLYETLLGKDPTLYYTHAGMLVTKNGVHYDVKRVTNGKNLDQIYKDVSGVATPHSYDYDGVYNMKNLLLKIFTTTYSGISSEDLDEAAKAALLADPDNRIFDIRMQMTDGRNFHLGFYRYSDGRCLIRFSNEDEGIVNTELFINALEVKGLVSAVRALANGLPVDTDAAYTPDVE